MITPRDALGFPGARLSGKDQALYNRAFASIIATIREQYTGVPISVPFTLRDVPTKVIYALKRRFETEGWSVAIMAAQGQDGKVGGHRLDLDVAPGALADKPVPTVIVQGVSTAPAPPSTKPSAESLKILVRMATRARPEQALRVLAAYRQLASRHVGIEVVVDDDDLSMRESTVLRRLVELDCTLTVGHHASKIEAVNDGCEDIGDILVVASDDMVPIASGWDDRVEAAMKEHFPLLDGLVYFNDGYNKSQWAACTEEDPAKRPPVTCTMPIFGRHLYNQFGSVYSSAYRSLYCDNEQTEFLTSMHRIRFVDEVVFEHRHPAAGKAVMDALYRRNEGLADVDKQTFEVRRAQGFSMPVMRLSILIASVTDRAPQLTKLVTHLQRQIESFAPLAAEIVVEVDDGSLPIGTKRQRLLERAIGQYVAHVDDDDWVDPFYVKRLVEAIEANQGVDCLSLSGVMTTNGECPERFEHSLKHDRWYTREDGVHCRCPNHLNAIRRDLALKVGFPAVDAREDIAFSTKVLPLLKTEASAGETPLYFYWYSRTKTDTATAETGRAVVSLSVFGDAADDTYWRYLPIYIRAHHALYPGWELRIHHDESLDKRLYGKVLRNLDAQKIIKLVAIPPRAARGKCESMLWRLAPAWDLNVSYVFCRDVDALPTWRERCAVEEFIAAASRDKVDLHTILDHEEHTGIMGGLCGVRASALRKMFGSFSDFVRKAGFSDEQWSKHGADQAYLNETVATCLRVFEHALRETRRYRSPYTASRHVCRILDVGPPEVDSVVREYSDKLVPCMGVAEFDRCAVFDFYDKHSPASAAMCVAEAEAGWRVEALS